MKSRKKAFQGGFVVWTSSLFMVLVLFVSSTLIYIYSYFYSAD